MPYIVPRERLFFEELLNAIGDVGIGHPGQLNYLFTTLCNLYIKQHGNRYETLNAVVGALECCKQELYRRRIGPYEDSKIKDNGDV